MTHAPVAALVQKSNSFEISGNALLLRTQVSLDLLVLGYLRNGGDPADYRAMGIALWRVDHMEKPPPSYGAGPRYFGLVFDSLPV